MQALLRQLGRRIGQIRKVRSLTQEALAERMDLSPQYLSRIEGGHQSPSVETLATLAEVLGVEVWGIIRVRGRGHRQGTTLNSPKGASRRG